MCASLHVDALNTPSNSSIMILQSSATISGLAYVGMLKISVTTTHKSENFEKFTGRKNMHLFVGTKGYKISKVQTNKEREANLILVYKLSSKYELKVNKQPSRFKF